MVLYQPYYHSGIGNGSLLFPHSLWYSKRIILIMIEYSVRDFVLCGCSVLLILASDDTAHAALLIAYIMVIRLGILAVGADQSQSTDIADDVAAVVLLCYDFPVFIIEELH